MMSANQELTRTKALAAAASVVLASVSGCAGKNTPPPATTDSTGAQAPAHTPAATPSPPTVAEVRAPHQDVCGPAGDIGACCTALHEACAEAFGSDGQAYEDCVYRPLEDGPEGCTPWGPPVPPAMV